MIRVFAHRGARVVLVSAVLAGTGWASRPLVETAWQEIRAAEPAFHPRSLEGTVGQGLTLGLLGGFRAVLADFVWLKMNSHWEQRQLPPTHKLIELTTAIDPRPLYFWINGARIIAYDMPVWRYEEAGVHADDPSPLRRAIDEEQAQAALEVLNAGLQVHPHNPHLLIEIANIHLHRRKDLESAAAFYRLAAEQPGAPRYAARIHAEVLKQLGRPREAYDWLRQIYPGLPPEDPMTPFVLGRIRELEAVLNLPAWDPADPATPRMLGR